MKRAFYGGSFNPPHLAHVMVCAYALARHDVDRIIMAPCGQHAFDKPLAPVEHRLAMCRLAVEGVFDRVEVSDIEARREGPSYTIDTLERLRRDYPDDDLALVVGTDAYAERDQWKDFARIETLAEIIVVPRLSEAADERPADSLSHFLPAVSATRLRERIRSGQVPHEALPWRVADYIIAHGLYAQAQ